MACQRDGTEQYDYASVPILVTDYLNAPTQWIMANGNGGKINLGFLNSANEILVKISGFLNSVNETYFDK